jgi:hypothetical protein
MLPWELVLVLVLVQALLVLLRVVSMWILKVIFEPYHKRQIQFRNNPILNNRDFDLYTTHFLWIHHHRFQC